MISQVVLVVSELQGGVGDLCGPGYPWEQSGEDLTLNPNGFYKHVNFLYKI